MSPYVRGGRPTARLQGRTRYQRNFVSLVATPGSENRAPDQPKAHDSDRGLNTTAATPIDICCEPIAIAEREAMARHPSAIASGAAAIRAICDRWHLPAHRRESWDRTI